MCYFSDLFSAFTSAEKRPSATLIVSRSPAATCRTDVTARPQIILTMQAPSDSALVRYLSENRDIEHKFVRGLRLF